MADVAITIEGATEMMTHRTLTIAMTAERPQTLRTEVERTQRGMNGQMQTERFTDRAV